MLKYIFIVLCIVLFSENDEQEKIMYEVTQGFVQFTSDAPLELIVGKSDDLKGLLDAKTGNFAFVLQIKSFENFKSPLQKEHFNEHYLESDIYPKATFTGHIIGFKNCELECDTTVFAKGKINIHGVEKIITVKSKLQHKGKKIKIEADFTVSLADFNIGIPKILEAKISPEIAVEVEINLAKNEK